MSRGCAASATTHGVRCVALRCERGLAWRLIGSGLVQANRRQRQKGASARLDAGVGCSKQGCGQRAAASVSKVVELMAVGEARVQVPGLWLSGQKKFWFVCVGYARSSRDGCGRDGQGRDPPQKVPKEGPISARER